MLLALQFLFQNLKFSAAILFLLIKTKRRTILIPQNQILNFNNPLHLDFGTTHQFNQIDIDEFDSISHSPAQIAAIVDFSKLTP